MRIKFYPKSSHFFGNKFFFLDFYFLKKNSHGTVLIQPDGDARDEDKRDEMQDLFKVLKEELKRNVGYNFKFLLKTGGFYMYHEDLEEEVISIQRKDSGKKLSQLLRYLAPYTPDQ